MIAELLLGIPLAGSLGINAWLTYRAVRGSEREADARIAQVEMESHLERVQFELEAATNALKEEKRRNRILAEAVHAEIARNPNSDLASDDWRGRLRRFEVEFSTDDDLLASGELGGVSSDPAADTAKAGEVPKPATELR